MKTNTQYPRLISDLPENIVYYILTNSYYTNYDGYKGDSYGTTNYVGIYLVYTEDAVKAWIKQNFEMATPEKFRVVKAIPLKVETTVNFNITQ